jgi:cytoskeletal protein CcmA (bactofilin family)
VGIFDRKKKEEFSSGISEPSPFTARRSETMNEDRAFGAATTIGKMIKMVGDLSGSDDVKVEGNFEGKINLEKNLTVGKNAFVKAEVIASQVKVEGKVLGNITAKSRVEVLPSGSVEGDIKSPKVMISEGAFFRGKVDMGKVTEPISKEVSPVVKAQPESTPFSVKETKETKGAKEKK